MDNNFWSVVYKLPKGFKWGDGEKYKVIDAIYNSRKYWRTIILLEVNNDLYIKGVLKGKDKSRTPIVVINNWRDVPIYDISSKFYNLPSVYNILLKCYHKHDIYCGLMVPVLRDILPNTK